MPTLVLDDKREYGCHLFDKDGLPRGISKVRAINASAAAEICFSTACGLTFPDDVFFVTVYDGSEQVALVVRNDFVRRARLFMAAMRAL